MYTEEELYSELYRYLKDGKCDDSTILSALNDVKSIIEEENIDTACQRIREYVELPDTNKNILYPKKTRLPYWIKLLVFIKIYRILDVPEPSTSQDVLLKDMGLPPDIFREKHWDMYSPDLKARQNKYETVHFPFSHAEVESNEIFRAMIHYMIKYSKVSTDTFVDMFGKLGIIPLFCAKGYSRREIWLNTERDYKNLMIFKKAMRKPVKITKRIKEIQRELLRISDDDKRVTELYRYLGLAATMSLEISGLDVETINLICADKTDKEPLPFDMYDFAAYYIIQNIITPGYWEDKNLTVIEDEETTHIRSTLRDISTREIVKFAKNSFDDGIKEYAKALNTTKACTIRYLDVKEYLEFPYHMRALLYIDPPKYLREEKRFQFGYDDYCDLFALLRACEGDWILVWKNYVEKSSGRASIYSGLYTQNKIEQDEYWFEEDNSSAGENDGSIPQIRQNNMLKLYGMLDEINKQRRIYVFRFRNNDSRHPNSILFFTTIDFLDVNVDKFNEKYGVFHTTDGDYDNDPVLEKVSYHDFYLNSIKARELQ